MIQKLKEIILKSKAYNWLYHIYCCLYWREKKKGHCWGREKEKIFYVVRRKSEGAGLFSHVMNNMAMCQYAINKGYIPVIDMQNYSNIYLKKELIGKENAWEYYFEQPCKYNLSDIEKCKNIILAGRNIISEINVPDYHLIQDKDIRIKWKNFFQNYFHIKDELMNECNQIYNNLFGEKKVLGILARGTDYTTVKPSGHPIQPNSNMIIEVVEKIYKEKSYEYIYLATEDEYIYNDLKGYFGNILLTTKAKRYKESESALLCQWKEFKDEDPYVKGHNYLINILLLTKCKGLVAGITSGTYGALLIKKDDYEDEYVFNLGFYE